MTEKNITTAIAEYNPIAAVIADLTSRHKGVLFDVSQASGMAAAKAAAKDIAQYRIALEKKRTELKASVLERGRLIDGEAKTIAAQLAALEDPIVDQIKAEERRIEAEREAAIKAEQARLEAEERAHKEAEEKRIAEERAKLQAEREAFERQQAEAREAERKRQAALAEEERQRRAKLDEEERQARAARQAEEDRIRAERQKLEDEQRAKDAEARRQREEQEAKEREARREQDERERAERKAEADRADGHQILVLFVENYGQIEEFAGVVKAIRTYLKPRLKAKAA